jgi:hypothetical protein
VDVAELDWRGMDGYLLDGIDDGRQVSDWQHRRGMTEGFLGDDASESSSRRRLHHNELEVGWLCWFAWAPTTSRLLLEYR